MLKTVYLYDSDGYYAGESLAQESTGANGVKSWIMPPQSTDKAPELSATHWARFVNGEWVKVAKPKTASECLGVVIRHESNTAHNLEYRKLMETFTEGSTTHRLKRGDDLSWYVEAIPQEEKDLNAVQSSISEFDGKINALLQRMALAMLIGDDEQVKAIRAEYLKLMEEA